MPDSMREPPEGFLTMAQARERLGVSKMTMMKLVQRSGIEVFQDQRDARVKLVREQDVERLQRPVPLGSGEGKEAA